MSASLSCRSTLASKGLFGSPSHSVPRTRPAVRKLLKLQDSNSLWVRRRECIERHQKFAVVHDATASLRSTTKVWTVLDGLCKRITPTATKRTQRNSLQHAASKPTATCTICFCNEVVAALVVLRLWSGGPYYNQRSTHDVLLGDAAEAAACAADPLPWVAESTEATNRQKPFMEC